MEEYTVGQWVGMMGTDGNGYRGFVKSIVDDELVNVFVLGVHYVPGESYKPSIKRIKVSGLIKLPNELHAYDRSILIDLALEMRDEKWFEELTKCLRVKQ